MDCLIKLKILISLYLGGIRAPERTETLYNSDLDRSDRTRVFNPATYSQSTRGSVLEPDGEL
jgi:hypothetical protein